MARSVGTTASDALWEHMTDEEKAEAWREAYETDVA
jgi:hypothetical protein